MALKAIRDSPLECSLHLAALNPLVVDFTSKLSRENTIVDGGSAVGRGVVDDAGFVAEETAPSATTVWNWVGG